MLDALAFCREVILKQFFRHVKMQPAFCRELHLAGQGLHTTWKKVQVERERR